MVILIPALPLPTHQAPPPPKRAPTTALTLRSKSMTAELEELGKATSPCCPQSMHGLLLAGLPMPRPACPPAPCLAWHLSWRPRWDLQGWGCFSFCLSNIVLF